MMEPRPVKARATKQARSAQSRERIVKAAIETLADKGVSRLTHRMVADKAGMPFSATTYYYAGKFDIVADASNELLAAYIEAFRRAAERFRERPGDAPSFHAFVARLLVNAAGRHRTGTMAWCEIMLDAGRHEEARRLARSWYVELRSAWSDIACTLSADASEDMVNSAIDITSGLLLMIVSLGLDERQVRDVVVDGGDPSVSWRVAAAPQEEIPGHSGRKAAATRERIMQAATDLLMESGPGAISYRAVAERAALSTASPVYYFGSIEVLLEQAQRRLFERSKDRYRDVMGRAHRAAIRPDDLVDLTTAIFQREATEFAPDNLASFTIWLEAGRTPRHRSMIWESVDDQNIAWTRLLRSITPVATPLHALTSQALFLGKLMRMMGIGSDTIDLARVRSEFGLVLGSGLVYRFWRP